MRGVSVVIILVAALTLAACGSNETTGAGGGGTPASATQEKDTLSIGYAALPVSWDNATSYGAGVQEVMGSINDVLWAWKSEPYEDGGSLSNTTAPNFEDALEPRLAESWQIDGNDLLVKLRKGVTSHAGNELTAADVVWTIERDFGMQGIAYATEIQGGLEKPADVKVVDDHTVRFELNQSPSVFMMGAALPQRAIYDSTEAKKHVTQSDDWASKWIATGDAGFGPYTLGSFKPGNSLELQAYDGYWGEKPTLRSVLLKEVPESSSRVALSTRGALDMGASLTPVEATSLADSTKPKVMQFPSPNAYYLKLGPEFEPFDDQSVRQAVAWAVPYDEIVDGLFKGYGRRAGGVVNSRFPGYSEHALEYETDLEKAGQMIEAAGVGSAAIEVAYDNSDPNAQGIGVLVASNLKKIGIEAKAVGLPKAAFVASTRSKDKSKQYPMYVLGTGPWVPDPYYVFQQTMLSTSPVNIFGVEIPGADEKINAMADQTLEERVQAADELGKMMVDYAASIFLTEQVNVSAVGEGVAPAFYIDWFDFANFQR